MTFIIAADEIKKSLPDYDPDQSGAFHRESTRLADKMYAQALKERSEPTVILMSGGTASGKSEYVSAYLKDANAIILDGTLPTISGAEIKIRKADKAKKRVEVHCVLPESLMVAFMAFLNRDRKFANEHFFRTHSSSRKTVLEIAEKFPDLLIKITISNVNYSGGASTMDFREVVFADHISLIEFLHEQQYTEANIKKAIFGL
jgi:hypothetical protein